MLLSKSISSTKAVCYILVNAWVFMWYWVHVHQGSVMTVHEGCSLEGGVLTAEWCTQHHRKAHLLVVYYMRSHKMKGTDSLATCVSILNHTLDMNILVNQNPSRWAGMCCTKVLCNGGCHVQNPKGKWDELHRSDTQHWACWTQKAQNQMYFISCSKPIVTS